MKRPGGREKIQVGKFPGYPYIMQRAQLRREKLPEFPHNLHILGNLPGPPAFLVVHRQDPAGRGAVFLVRARGKLGFADRAGHDDSPVCEVDTESIPHFPVVVKLIIRNRAEYPDFSGPVVPGERRRAGEFQSNGEFHYVVKQVS